MGMLKQVKHDNVLSKTKCYCKDPDPGRSIVRPVGFSGLGTSLEWWNYLSLRAPLHILSTPHPAFEIASSLKLLAMTSFRPPVNRSPRNDREKLSGDGIPNVLGEYTWWTLPSPEGIIVREYSFNGKDLIRESREQSGEGPRKRSLCRHR